MPPAPGAYTFSMRTLGAGAFVAASGDLRPTHSSASHAVPEPHPSQGVEWEK